jgi:two-component system, NtrC family, response regulator HydG
MVGSTEMAEPPNDGDHVSTVRKSRSDAPPDARSSPAGTFALVVIEGPDTGTRFAVDGSHAPHLLGQGPFCDLRLMDPQVSRRHAALELLGSKVRLRDLGSTNGTLVDRLGVVEAYLEGGEVLRLGASALRVERLVEASRANLSSRSAFGGLLGASRAMRRLYPWCERLASSTIPVIIEGETGTGKEVLAESLHDCGPRAAAPFVVFDCTAVPANLVESELFGHERGAFTGAHSTRKGVFEQASGGTLFIDEIGDLDLQLQSKLLRAVERSEIRRVGSDRWMKLDTRILCATRRDLDREVQEGRFRDDLLHRLAVGRIELPPLRARAGDVPMLVHHFCKELCADATALPKALVARWEQDPWPGNVRELRNAVARHVTLGDIAIHDPIEEQTDDVEPRVPALAASVGREPAHSTVGGPADAIERVLDQNLPLIVGRQVVVDEYERRYIRRVLEAHGGNVMRAAKASGIARRYFQKLRSRVGPGPDAPTGSSRR